jgi:hypothetical protein
MPQEEEQITVTLSAKDWRLIEFLSGRDAIHETNAYLLSRQRALEAEVAAADRPVHTVACIEGFLQAHQTLATALKQQLSRETAPPLPTSPTAE